MSHHHHHGHHDHDSCCSHHHQDSSSSSHAHDEESCHDHSHDHHCASSCGHEHEDFYDQLLKVADCAWMEVLKCKIKSQIEKTCGGQLEELAKIVSDANHSRWKHKIATKTGAGNFKNKIRAFFSSDECCQEGGHEISSKGGSCSTSKHNRSW